MTNLRLCPFCGGQPKTWKGAFVWPGMPEVKCERCGDTMAKADLDNAVLHWNRRTPGPATLAMIEWSRPENYSESQHAVYFPMKLVMDFLAEWEDIPDAKA